RYRLDRPLDHGVRRRSLHRPPVLVHRIQPIPSGLPSNPIDQFLGSRLQLKDQWPTVLVDELRRAAPVSDLVSPHPPTHTFLRKLDRVSVLSPGQRRPRRLRRGLALLLDQRTNVVARHCHPPQPPSTAGSAVSVSGFNTANTRRRSPRVSRLRSSVPCCSYASHPSQRHP